MTDSRTFQRILVGVDARGLASEALIRAFGLARTFGGELDLLHVVEAPLPRGAAGRNEAVVKLSGQYFELERERAERVVAAAREAAGADGASPKAALETVPGRAAEALLERAESGRADLIVIGPHAERGVFDFGSTARALLGHVRVPVWSQHGPPVPIERVLVPVDLSEHSGEAVRVATGLAEAFGAPLTLLHSYLPPVFAYDADSPYLTGSDYVVDADREHERAELDRWVAELALPGGDRVTTLFREGDPRVSVAEETKPGDLVVLGTQGRTGFSRFLLGSVAHAVVRASQGQVVVVPSSKAK